MSVESIQHTFYDIELEHMTAPHRACLIKILSIDGRRFTYELRAELTEDAVTYIKSLIDGLMFGDLILEPGADGFEASEAKGRLKKHS